jgi:hypothetical protein
VFPLQYIPSGPDLSSQLLIGGLLAVLFGSVAWVLAGRRDPDNRRTWTTATAGTALFPWTGPVLLLLLLVSLTDAE